jgi:hypothetical protein
MSPWTMPMNGSETPATVALMNGLTVSIDAYNLALHLAEHGFRLQVDGDGLLVAHRKLSDRERDLIRSLKDDLLAIAQYEKGVM